MFHPPGHVERRSCEVTSLVADHTPFGQSPCNSVSGRGSILPGPPHASHTSPQLTLYNPNGVWCRTHRNGDPQGPARAFCLGNEGPAGDPQPAISTFLGKNRTRRDHTRATGSHPGPPGSHFSRSTPRSLIHSDVGPCTVCLTTDLSLAL